MFHNIFYLTIRMTGISKEVPVFFYFLIFIGNKNHEDIKEFFVRHSRNRLDEWLRFAVQTETTNTNHIRNQYAYPL